MASLLSKYVRPETLAQVARMTLRPQGLVEGNLAGAHASPRHGFAVEFAGHRAYAPGDDVRHLDWKVYYRRDKHVIKQYEMETNLVCHLVLDVSASMRYGEGAAQKWFYAAQIAATLGYLVVGQQDKVSLALVGERIGAVLPASATAGQMERMAALLEAVEPAGKTRLGRTLLELAPRLGRRALVVIISDFLGAPDDSRKLEDVLQRLRFDRHEVVLVQVLHHDELTFDLAGTVQFVGLESATTERTQPADIREEYLKNLRRFLEYLAGICDGHHSEYVLCDTAVPVARMLADYLQQRDRQRR